VHIGPINTSSGNMTNSDAELVNSFNDHFVNVFTAEDTSFIPLPANRFVLSSLDRTNLLAGIQQPVLGYFLHSACV